MAEFNNIGLKLKTYAWLGEFRNELAQQLGRKVTFSEAAGILFGLAAKGMTGKALARVIAREMKEGVVA